MSAVNEQAQRVLKFFGEDGHRVVSTVGAEQEYFLISEKDYVKRQDLIMTGRTLFGAAPLKGQELEEHYFGAIRPTVNEFMKEVDDDLWALGVSAKTKHNEVAPAQHELAPLFTNSNRAIDENLLTMEKMRLDASHHGLVCLQHEKPFEGINGSGKHNNWSLSYDKVNLLDRRCPYLWRRIPFRRCYRNGLGRCRSSEVYEGQHRPQPHQPLRVHGQQVRIPHAWLFGKPFRLQHDLEHRNGKELEGLRRCA